MSVVVVGVVVVSTAFILFHIFKFVVSAPDQAYISKLKELQKPKSELKKAGSKKAKTPKSVDDQDKKPHKVAQKAEQKKAEKPEKQGARLPSPAVTTAPSSSSANKKVTVVPSSSEPKAPVQEKKVPAHEKTTTPETVASGSHAQTEKPPKAKQEKPQKQKQEIALKHEVPNHETAKHDTPKLDTPQPDTPKVDAHQQEATKSEINEKKEKQRKEKKPKKEVKGKAPVAPTTEEEAADAELVALSSDYRPPSNTAQTTTQQHSWAKVPSGSALEQLNALKTKVAELTKQIEDDREELRKTHKAHNDETTLLIKQRQISEQHSVAHIARLEKEIQTLKAGGTTQKVDPLSQKNYASKGDVPKQEKPAAPKFTEIMQEEKVAKQKEEELNVNNEVDKNKVKALQDSHDQTVAELKKRISELEASHKEVKPVSAPAPSNSNKKVEDLEIQQRELYKQASAKDEMIRYLSSLISSDAEQSKLNAGSSNNQTEEVERLTKQVKDLNSKIQTTEAALSKAKADTSVQQANDELKALKASFAEEKDNITKALQKAEASAKQANDELKTLQASSSAGKDKEAAAGKDLQNARYEIEQLKKELATSKQNNDTSSSQLKEEKARAAQEVERLTKELSATKQSGDNGAQAIAQIKEEKAKVQQEVERLTKELAAAKQSADSSSQTIAQEKTKAQQEVERLTKELSSVKQSGEGSAQTITQLQDEKAKVQQEVERIGKELASTKQANDASSKATTQAKEELKQVQQENERLKKEAADSAAKAGSGDAKSAEEIARLNRDLTAANDRVNSSLQQLVQSREERKNLIASVEEKEKRVQELTSQLSEQGGANTKETERLKKELETLHAAHTKLGEEHKTTTNTLKEKNDASTSSTAKVTELTNALAAYKKDAEAASQKREADLKKLEEQVKAKEGENTTLQTRLEEERASRSDVTKRLEDVQTRVKDLEAGASAGGSGLKFLVNSGAPAMSPKPMLPAFAAQQQQLTNNNP